MDKANQNTTPLPIYAAILMDPGSISAYQYHGCTMEAASSLLLYSVAPSNSTNSTILTAHCKYLYCISTAFVLHLNLIVCSCLIIAPHPPNHQPSVHCSPEYLRRILQKISYTIRHWLTDKLSCRQSALKTIHPENLLRRPNRPCAQIVLISAS